MTDRFFGSLTDAPLSLVLTGVRVLDPDAGTDLVRDLAILDGRLADPAAAPRGAQRLDGRGLVAAPGLCDLHTHLRQPGGAGETLASGTRAAAHGGFTTVCAMPNTDPPLDEPERVAHLLDPARDAAARVRVVAAATVGRSGAQPVDVATLAAIGVIGFSDDGSTVADPQVAAALMRSLARLGLPLMEHAEDPTLAGGTVMRAGPTATRLGLAGWPPAAEVSVVERDIALAEATGARLHLTHLSTAGALDAVRRAKDLGLPVTCDVTPHHLALTDAWVAGDRRFAWEDPMDAPLDPATAYDGNTRVNPPLASREDALALLAGVADGSVDAIATDHAPHPLQRKAVEFGNAASGMIGLETALSLGLAAVNAGRLTLPRLLAALSTQPARLIGEPRSLAIGAPADLVIFDPAARWTVSRAALASGSANTPLLGRELPGVVRLTVANGRVTYRDWPA